MSPTALPQPLLAPLCHALPDAACNGICAQLKDVGPNCRDAGLVFESDEIGASLASPDDATSKSGIGELRLDIPVACPQFQVASIPESNSCFGVVPPS